MAKKTAPSPAVKGSRAGPTINNRRARYDYLILQTYEAGIMLAGAEVKSIRDGKANLADAYGRVQNHEVWLHGMHISPYEYSRGDLDPIRPRKLLLHHREIDDIERATAEKGVTIVPLRLFIDRRGHAKLEIGLGRGKQLHDRRRDIAERDAKRDLARAMADTARGRS